MRKGTILYHRKFEFLDDQLGEKLLIILNSPNTSKNQPYLCCKTTSKQKFNIEKEGCYSKQSIYFLDANSDWFKEKTWIQFHDIYEFKCQEFLQAHFKGDLTIKSELKELSITSIIACIKKSDDISNYHLDLLS